MATYPLSAIREQFPILGTSVQNKKLVYLDNAATVQKPKAVLDSIRCYYEQINSNIHRGAHTLSSKATNEYENARRCVARFIGAEQAEEIVFVRGCTEGINIVADGFRRTVLQRGDEVVVSVMDHHSNFLPWQQACEASGASLRVVPVLPDGSLDMQYFHSLLSPKVKMVSLLHVSNALGTLNPVAEIIEAAHKVGAQVLLDGAQAIQHVPLDMKSLDCDYYVFSGHKIYAPTGIGCLYGKKHLLEALPPYQYGGSMIRSVSIEGSVFGDVPNKFEAGTPNIEGAIALAAAIDYVDSIGIAAIARHEDELVQYLRSELSRRPAVNIIGKAKGAVGAVSFLVNNTHPSDVATLLDMQGVAVRAGHHCTEPLMKHFDIPGTVRASVAMYSSHEEIDILLQSIDKATKMLT